MQWGLKQLHAGDGRREGRPAGQRRHRLRRSRRPRRRRGSPPSPGTASRCRPIICVRADGRRDQPGQHRRRPLQRQDHHRPPRGAAARMLADDRPLRRPARSRRRSATMCWPTPICATTTSWTTCCRWRSPIPALAEVQVALQEAVAEVTGERGEALKRRLRTGTVVTTDDRNWELRWSQERARSQQSRAIAVDMEIGDHRRPGLPLPRALRHAALRLRQAAARRDQAARRRPTPSTSARSPSTCRSASPRSDLLREQGRRACTRASCAASTSRRSGDFVGRGR